MDSLSINLEFGSIKLELTFEPTKENVVNLFAFINEQMSMSPEDPRAAVLAGLSDRLKSTTDKIETAVGEQNAS